MLQNFCTIEKLTKEVSDCFHMYLLQQLTERLAPVFVEQQAVQRGRIITARCNRRYLQQTSSAHRGLDPDFNALWSILKTFNVKQQAVSVAAMSSSYFMYSLATSLSA